MAAQAPVFARLDAVNPRVRNARNPEAIALVAQATDPENGNPHTSVRQTARQLGMSKTAVHKIRRKDLNLKAWKRMQVQELKPGDVPLRARVCEELLDRVDVAENNPLFPGDRFVNRVIWSDECTVSSEGHFTSQNSRHWAAENPHCKVVTHVQGRWKVNVWAGILHNKIVGPYFFDEALNQHSYCHLLRHELPLLLDGTPNEIRQSCWFMQDGCSSHTSIQARRVLNSPDHWRDKWIGKFSPVQVWPARSPDLTPCDFWLWGTLKARLFPADGGRYENQQQLKDAIRRECRAIPEEEISRVWENMLRRLGACVAANGGHIEHVL
ncbi:hypothetical protein FOCC_FOCC016497 [Frankliniella occidentalis]|nr:hypothetical protein FOCC_FOCC016497 [Frankliniella occidentalis]